MSGTGEEQRGFPRAPIELKVEYHKLNTFFHDYTRNISKGGTFIKTPSPLAIGTEFVFSLSVPRLENLLQLRGRVKWVVSEDQAGRDPEQPDAGMGIEFLFEDDSARQKVHETVEALRKEHLGERAFAKMMGH